LTRLFFSFTFVHMLRGAIAEGGGHHGSTPVFLAYTILDTGSHYQHAQL
jgi:hypothetical protein